ncbi:LOW QUALITY PROTEIN: hypothetical protein PHMEG_0008015 [Phytophthora megakarya]|uniref:Uncharacterized protein n=1 Tax=Phytophthora megakarya TaxID=4795 RepID=A0A225WM63_9STRA|nr:LOW QUALITY PROTEIN: hypothetical protein PHMEG_0008015 [Phytophthora megakarya]
MLGNQWERVQHLPGGAPVEVETSQSVPRSPNHVLVDSEESRVHFDETPLPEDSGEVSLNEDEFEVERIADVRSGRRTRYDRRISDLLDEPTWVDEAGLNCGALLAELNVTERAAAVLT